MPTRYSDIEDSPPLVAAGFVGDEIPRVDPLDSDGEWQPTPTLADLLPTKAATSQPVTGEEGQIMGIMEEKKKRKRRKKKSKGVQTTFLTLVDGRLKVQRLWKWRKIRRI